jgi:hypothetical protein
MSQLGHERPTRCAVTPDNGCNPLKADMILLQRRVQPRMLLALGNRGVRPCHNEACLLKFPTRTP